MADSSGVNWGVYGLASVRLLVSSQRGVHTVAVLGFCTFRRGGCAGKDPVREIAGNFTLPRRHWGRRVAASSCVCSLRLGGARGRWPNFVVFLVNGVYGKVFAQSATKELAGWEFLVSRCLPRCPRDAAGQPPR